MYVLGTVLIRVITTLFFIGMAGSAIVIAISFVQDFQELLGPDDELSPGPAEAQNPAPLRKGTA